MIPKFIICKQDDCVLKITDTTSEYIDTYIPEDVVSYKELKVGYQNTRYKYSDTYTLNFIQYTSTSGTELVSTIFTDHSSVIDEAFYKVPKDGFYTITHLILPSVEWLHSELQMEENSLPFKDSIYVTDGEFVYQYKNCSLEKIDAKILIDINIESTTISRSSEDIFSYCDLYTCYINMCKQLLSSGIVRCFNRPNSKNYDSSLESKRDFVYMVLTVIQYYIEFNMLHEAQRILEEINYCGGYCKDYYNSNKLSIKNKTSNNCGCH